MKTWKYIFAASSLAISVLTACTSAQAESECLKVVTFDWSATLIVDPAQIVNNSDLMHANAAYEPLVVFDNDFVVKPWLAESFAASPDGTEWTFVLRKGVKFHSGKALTSADVVLAPS